ncbi:uncharacterized protein VICG_01875 [Vittaforma corneae ATCC 50505]|uniref:Uncharacterized protein n=1 Tax=Vittaforma corneae (strain ATCC 50505) TaxID=993615 RepID=L2GLC0_VITCO|nr:uncharacterized protein VICG_01875 [Vittaforma corneae ATCC 50505]ELA41082.1 hypothetical protein VICG_01875 [Vittaforma corneae ATCC 50505]
MTSTKSETSEVERKLQELVSFYKYEPEKSAMREIMAKFKATGETTGSLKESLENSQISHLLIKFNSAKKHIFVLDLIYLCLVYDVYSKEDVFKIIENLCKQSWDLPFKVKILQMSFYFVRFDLTFEMCFKLLSMIVESFVVEDPSIDLISRPVVCQVIEKILSKNMLENESYTRSNEAESGTENNYLLEYGHPRKLFEFLYDNIVYKKQTFPSYILLLIMKFPNIEKHPEFATFLKDYFIECCLVIFSKGKNDDRLPMFEAVLKVEKSFSSFASLNSFFEHFPSIYKKNPKCDLMLRFLSCLFPIRVELLKFPFPSQLSAVLLSFVKDTNFSLAESEIFLRLFGDIVKNLRTEFEVDGIISSIFDKIGGLSSVTTNINMLYFDSLKYCAKNDLRDLFDKGLVCGYACKRESLKSKHENEKPKSGKATPEKHEDMKSIVRMGINAEDNSQYCIEEIDKFIFDTKDYMGPSWSIYFDNNGVYELERLKEFSEKNLESFIDAVPHGIDLSLMIFESSAHNFQIDKTNETRNAGLALFEKLLCKICNHETLFEIILRFYLLNSGVVADPSPLRILLKYLKSKTVENDEGLFIANELTNLIKNLDLESMNIRSASLQGDTRGQQENSACLGVSRTVSTNAMESVSIHGESNSGITLCKLQGLVVSDLYSFLSKVIEATKPERCWNEIFNLLRLGHGFLSNKLDIILQIEQSFISVLNEEHLESLHVCLIESFVELVEFERKHDDSTKEGHASIEQLYAKTLKAFDAFMNHLSKEFRSTPIWRRAVLFSLKLIDNGRYSTRAGKNENHASKVKLDAFSSHFLEAFFSFLGRNYKELSESEVLFLNEVLFVIIYEMKSRDIVLETLARLASLLKMFLLKYRMSELVGYITKMICGEDEEIAAASFEILRIISSKVKEETLLLECAKVDSRLHNPKDTAVDDHTVEKRTVLKYKGKKKKNKAGKHASVISAENNKNSKIIFEKEKIDFNALNSAKESELESKIDDNRLADPEVMKTRVFKGRLVTILTDSFKKILSECSPLRYSIVSQVFLEIPSFIFSTLEIASLSEYLKKYVEMPEPFRTNAIDCFIKTCGSSKQFSFCLETLSSWLSENSKETSLSLISKIGENLQRGDFSKLTGLNNFLDYSLQFCKSDDFLDLS